MAWFILILVAILFMIIYSACIISSNCSKDEEYVEIQKNDTDIDININIDEHL